MVAFTRETAIVWRELEETDRCRAVLLWDFCGRERPIEELLARTERFAVTEAAQPVGAWWQYGDAGLLFDAAHGVIGHAVQWGFVCADRRLWAAIAQAPSAPEIFSWELGEEATDEDDEYANDEIWSPEEDVEVLLRAAAGEKA